MIAAGRLTFNCWWKCSLGPLYVAAEWNLIGKGFGSGAWQQWNLHCCSLLCSLVPILKRTAAGLWCPFLSLPLYPSCGCGGVLCPAKVECSWLIGFVFNVTPSRLMGERAQQQWMTFAFWFVSSLALSGCPNGNFFIVAFLFMFWHVKLIFVLYAWWAVCCLNMESTVSLLSLCTIERQEYGTMGPGLLRILFTSIKTTQVSSLRLPILVFVVLI